MRWGFILSTALVVAAPATVSLAGAKVEHRQGGPDNHEKPSFDEPGEAAEAEPDLDTDDQVDEDISADEEPTVPAPSEVAPSIAEPMEESEDEPRQALTLDDALRIADEENPDLQAARHNLAAAREGARQAWAGYLPQVTLGGSYTYNTTEASIAFPAGFVVRDLLVVPDDAPGFIDFDPDEPIGPDNLPGEPTSLIVLPSELIEAEIQRRHQLGGQLQVSQALVAPSLWPAIRAAYLGEDVAELSVANVRKEILFAVAQIFYGAVGLREAVDLQERMLEVVEAHERDARLRVEQGTAPRLALLRARIERTQAEQELVRTRNSYEGVLSSLATLLDREPDFEIERPPEPEPLDEDEDALARMALEKRPDVRAARMSVDLSEEMRKVTRNRYLPNLGLNLTYQASNVRGFDDSYGAWIAGLGLSWTLFDGGLRESEMREASARIAESREQARAAEIRARDEIRRAMLDLESARSNLITAEEQARLAAENVELVRQAFEAGVATSLEMVDANAALRGAELGRINEQLNAELAALALARAAGLFRP